LPDMPPSDPQFIRAHQLRAERNAWCAARVGVPTSPPRVTETNTNTPEWTRIQCDGGCDQGSEHAVHHTGAGFSLAQAPFSFLPRRSTCCRAKG
jgi:hypothetical protein